MIGIFGTVGKSVHLLKMVRGLPVDAKVLVIDSVSINELHRVCRDRSYTMVRTDKPLDLIFSDIIREYDMTSKYLYLVLSINADIAHHEELIQFEKTIRGTVIVTFQT